MSAGKGDATRPYDAKTYGQNYDAIFRKTVNQAGNLCDDCDCEGSRDFDSNDETTYNEKP